MSKADIDHARLQRARTPKKTAQPLTLTEDVKLLEDFARLNSPHIRALRRGPTANQDNPQRTQLRPADVLALQRTIGNAAVQRMLAAPNGAVQRGFKLENQDYNDAMLNGMSLDDLQGLHRKILDAGQLDVYGDALIEIASLISKKQREVLPKEKPINVGGFSPVIITKRNMSVMLDTFNKWIAIGHARTGEIRQTPEYDRVKNYKKIIAGNSAKKQELQADYRKYKRNLLDPIHDSTFLVGTIVNAFTSTDLPSDNRPESLRDLQELFIAVEHSGHFQGVIHAKHGYIHSLAKNPATIGLPGEIKGVAKALMAEVIVRLRELEREHATASSEDYNPKPYELFAADFPIKQVYDYFNFKAKKGDQLVGRYKDAGRTIKNNPEWKSSEKKMQLPLADGDALTGHHPKTGVKVKP
ncbi:MAG: hypothetical protein H7175_02860 [Burkholderiales bacterium]|nr:hypothetical protein [Anaerolineae bacterium]